MSGPSIRVRRRDRTGHLYLTPRSGRPDPFARDLHVCRAFEPHRIHLDIQLAPLLGHGEHTRHISAGLNLSRRQALRLVVHLLRLVLSS